MLTALIPRPQALTIIKTDRYRQPHHDRVQSMNKVHKRHSLNLIQKVYRRVGQCEYTQETICHINQINYDTTLFYFQATGTEWPHFLY